MRDAMHMADCYAMYPYGEHEMLAVGGMQVSCTLLAIFTTGFCTDPYKVHSLNTGQRLPARLPGSMCAFIKPLFHTCAPPKPPQTCQRLMTLRNVPGTWTYNEGQLVSACQKTCGAAI